MSSTLDMQFIDLPAPTMTMRDYFAAKAMQAYVSSYPNTAGTDVIAEDAYDMADAMLAARDAAKGE